MNGGAFAPQKQKPKPKFEPKIKTEFLPIPLFRRPALSKKRLGGSGALKIGVGIFRKKSSNFAQKAPQFFKIKVFEVGGLGASRRKV